MEDTLNTALMLNRLRSLQWLCSDSDPASPKALLFVPGPDGRFNGGSTNFIKYLFKGSVGKELRDETLSEEMDILEDAVVLIKETSVSIIYSSPMKKLLAPLVANIPFLTEYTYTEEEENDIDKFQSRKCSNFKRMILESLSNGDGVGVPVPSAYDDIMEVENWPMLQAFALDSVVCPTGFFTARYTIADIGPNLDILFNTVDGYHVDNAIKLTKTMIASHVQQMHSILDCPTVGQRQRLTADDVLGPLHVLFEFGELEAAGIVENFLRPNIWLGSATSNVGSMKRADGWENEKLGQHMHAIVESSEPSTGMRWCRTLFFSSGKGRDLVEELQKLQKLSVDVEDGEEEGFSSLGDLLPADLFANLPGLAAEQGVSRRLLALYTKLWIVLRSMVRHAFLNATDILSAASTLQAQLSAAMSKDSASLPMDISFMSAYGGLFVPELCLQGHEHLQIHMDCMNALGEVITADDVEELGGACWIYVRVSVHGVQLHGKATGAVSVGDTFLFSPLAVQSEHRRDGSYHDNSSSRGRNTTATGDLVVRRGGPPIPLLSDSVCVTGSLPYLRNYLSQGMEEAFGRYTLRCLRVSNTLGLGHAMELTGSNTVSTLLLSDHPLAPITKTSLQVYNQGFLFTTVDGISTVPAVVSFERDVDRIWAVDLNEAILQAIADMYPSQAGRIRVPASLAGGGYLLVLGFKATSFASSYYRALPVTMSPGCSPDKDHFLGLAVPFEDAGSKMFQEVLERWKIAFRVNDIVEFRGSDVRVPGPLLGALMALLDSRAEVEVQNDDAPHALLMAAVANAVREEPVPGMRHESMLCSHALAEARRLSSFDFMALPELFEAAPPVKRPAAVETSLLVVTGLLGCGVDLASKLLVTQLTSHDRLASFQTELCRIDMASVLEESLPEDTVLASEVVQDRFKVMLQEQLQRLESVRRPNRNLLQIIVLVTCPQLQVRLTDLLAMIASSARQRVDHVVNVCSPSALLLDLNEPAGRGVGLENWRAQGLEMLQLMCCDSVVAVEAPGCPAASYRHLRTHLGLCNPGALLLRLTPHAVAFSADDVQQLVQLLQSSQRRSGDLVLEREARAMMIGYPNCVLQPRAGSRSVDVEARFRLYPSLGDLPTLSVHTFHPTASLPWALSSLVRLLTSVVLPDAKTSPYRLFDDWRPPAVSGSTGFQRILEVAAAKQLAKQHNQQIDKDMVRQLDLLTQHHSRALQELRSCVLSVQGHIVLHGQRFMSTGLGEAERSGDAPASKHLTPGGAIGRAVRIEANRGFLSLHEEGAAEVAEKPSRLVICGVFSQETLSVLHQLVRICQRSPLTPKPLLTVQSAEVVQARMRIQNMSPYASQPLPDGIWFDGSFYVDHHGTKSELRPDIQRLLQAFVQHENVAIARYNRLVQLLD